jgi:hypothetical protein
VARGREWLGRTIAAALAAATAACTPPQAVRQALYTEEPMEQPPLVLVYDFAVDPDDVIVDLFGAAFLPARSPGAKPEPESKPAALEPEPESKPRSKARSRAGSKFEPATADSRRSEEDAPRSEESSEASSAPSAEPPRRDELVANTLAAAIVERLRARGIRAERAGARTAPPAEAILVKGQFVTVNGDAESPRMTIGLGPDTSTLRVQVQAYQVAENGALRRIAEREVGGVGIVPAVMPSGSPTVGPPRTSSAVITGGLTFVLRSQTNVEADAQRLAELFAERAFDFYRRQGWL